MERTILDIRENLRAGRYTNEAAVSRGIILRILNDLSWPIFEPTIVAPEFNLAGTRVDYALCYPSLKPLILLEVKQVGMGIDAAQQLFGYAVHHGVPMAILTTGQEWHFFLPGERGNYEERRVYMLDLVARDTDECASRLKRYLDYGSVRNGTAYEAARTDLQDVAKEREIQRTLPDAWHQLISDGDDLLLDLVAEKVESMCGYKPSHDTVASFLKGGAQPLPSMVQTSSQSMIPARRASLPRGAKEAARDSSAPLSVEFLGEVYSASKQRDILLKTLQMMATRDPTFPERFAASKSGERSRRRLARSRLDLYPSNPRLAEEKAHSRELMPGSGWWVDLHMDWPATMKFIKEACAIAGLEFGVDVKLHMT